LVNIVADWDLRQQGIAGLKSLQPPASGSSGGARCALPEEGWVFPGIAGQPLSNRGAQIAIRKLAETVGIGGVSSHSFGRSALTEVG
jgi:integrase